MIVLTFMEKNPYSNFKSKQYASRDLSSYAFIFLFLFLKEDPSEVFFGYR